MHYYKLSEQISPQIALFIRLTIGYLQLWLLSKVTTNIGNFTLTSNEMYSFRM